VNRKPSPILASDPHSYTFLPSALSSPASSSTSETTNVALLTSLIRLAQLCVHGPLLSSMITLLRQLMTISIQYAYLAMTLADELDLKALRGAAYAVVMLKADIVRDLGMNILGGSEGEASVESSGTAMPNSASHWHGIHSSAGALAGPVPNLGVNFVATTTAITSTSPSSSPSSSPMPAPSPPITASQRLRLLTGYYRLTRMWDYLRVHPPSFGHASSCGATWHQHGCMQSWVEFWKEKSRTYILDFSYC
jgi:hypothetical protein